MHEDHTIVQLPTLPVECELFPRISNMNLVFMSKGNSNFDVPNAIAIS